MKTIANLLLLSSVVAGTLGQGTIQLEVELAPVPPFGSTPGMEYTGSGQFALSGTILNGSVRYPDLDRQSFTRIENSEGLSLFSPTKDISLAPEFINLATWSNLQLSDAQVSDLLSGDWAVNIGSVDYPDGALRGQIIVVPEPSTYALFTCGIVALAASRTRRAKETSRS